MFFLSFKDAIEFAKQGQFDSFLAVGGGSVIDTAKAANLYLCHPENDFLDFVNAPVGRGILIVKTLKPLIAGESLNYGFSSFKTTVTVSFPCQGFTFTLKMTCAKLFKVKEMLVTLR